MKKISVLLLFISCLSSAVWGQKTPLKHYVGPYLQTGALFDYENGSTRKESQFFAFAMDAGGCYQLERKRFWFNVALAYRCEIFQEKNATNDGWMIVQHAARYKVSFKQLQHIHSVVLPIQLGGVCYQKNRFSFGCFGGIGVNLIFFSGGYEEYRGSSYYAKESKKSIPNDYYILLFTGVTFNYAISPNIILSFIPQASIQDVSLRVQANFKIGKQERIEPL